MTPFDQIRSVFEVRADTARAEQMSHYMRDQFAFYGIASPERKKLYTDFLREEKKKKLIDWGFIDLCWADPHREFQYCALDYLVRMNRFVEFDDLDLRIRQLVETKSWWDSIDVLCKVVGSVGLRDERVAELMRYWATDENIWIRRCAIEHQLGRKENTDTALLTEIIEANLKSTEFFINKAIGWALRDYSKTDPDWVRNFIATHPGLSALSVREGSKYV